MALREADLIGTWRLVRYDFRAETGERLPRHPSGSLGLLHYGADGRMSAHLSAKDRRPTGDDMSAVDPAVAAEALAGYMAYAGPWRLEGGRVRHEVEMCLRPDWVGRTLWRTPSLAADGTLTLVAEGSRMDGRVGTAELDWVRA
ncbi:MAG: lipocalin-like domain-containing protein [Paracoccaceae bacterium]